MDDDVKMIDKGIGVIRGHAKQLPDTPGVYRMLSDHDDVLYVGKAKSLKKRVMSYTNYGKLPFRLQRMISQTRKMEFVHTHTEAEALLLESNLIKKLQPRYNILLRDDKSFPYIFVPQDHDYPQVMKHRGAKRRKGEYFGPFASAGDVNRTINILQRVFMIRNCTDSYFANRHRPCLQYHIKRCTAPCVGKVSKQDYAEQLKEAQDFLEGKSQAVQKRMRDKMQAASDGMNYEEAARYRDRIKALTGVQAKQDINIQGMKNADVIALVQQGGKICVQVFFFRSGRNLGNHSYFPRHSADDLLEDVMGAFMAQFYENKHVPQEILVNYLPTDYLLIEEALSSKITKGKVRIYLPQRGQKKRVLDFVSKNAVAALERHLLEKETEAKLLKGVAELFDMDEPPRRIEVYDNSHISGTNMVGGMIVAGPEGFQKNAYRKFNIKRADKADDYGMMREVFERRFKRAMKEQEEGNHSNWPDLVLVDGGKGQLSVCKEVLEDYGVLDQLTLVAIAKGEDRNAGREQFFVANGKMGFQLPINDPVLHYLQRVRDEVHRFAIGAHRTRRTQQISQSPLDEISGVGGARKKALLHRFGSAKAVSGAGVDDLAQVEGISKQLAQKIYDHFHTL
ncbi:MAG: excinuclease ABC subunit UvrC [Bdellovibrionales bacterium]